MNTFISSFAEGETCALCGCPAVHKISEEIFADDPQPARHGYSQYLCEEHFRRILKPYLFKDREAFLDIHPKVVQFALAMNKELLVNSHKGPWEEWKDVPAMIAELEWHKAKLLIAMKTNQKSEVLEHLADCGNILLFMGNAGDILQPAARVPVTIIPEDSEHVDAFPVWIIEFNNGSPRFYFRKSEWESIGGLSGVLKEYEIDEEDVKAVHRRKITENDFPVGEWEP